MARRRRGRPKARYTTNPITGQRERLPGRNEVRNPITGRIEKIKKPRYSSSRPRKITKAEREAQGVTIIIIAVLVAAYFVFDWISKHVLESILIGVLLIGVIILAFWKIPKLREAIFGKIKKKFKTFGPVSDNEVRQLVEEIKSMDVQTVRDEEDFEKQLYQRLDAKGYSLERQVQKEGRRRMDIVVNRRIAVELKIADRSKNIQDLIGQITVYKKYYKNIVVGILDYGRVSNLEEMIGLIRAIDPENIAVVVVSGDVKRRKKKEEYIMVKKSTSYK